MKRPSRGSAVSRVGAQSLAVSRPSQGHPAGDLPGQPLPLAQLLLRAQPLPVLRLLLGGAALHPALPAAAEADPPADAAQRPLPRPLDRGGPPATEGPGSLVKRRGARWRRSHCLPQGPPLPWQEHVPAPGRVSGPRGASAAAWAGERERKRLDQGTTCQRLPWHSRCTMTPGPGGVGGEQEKRTGSGDLMPVATHAWEASKGVLAQQWAAVARPTAWLGWRPCGCEPDGSAALGLPTILSRVPARLCLWVKGCFPSLCGRALPRGLSCSLPRAQAGEGQLGRGDPKGEPRQGEGGELLSGGAPALHAEGPGPGGLQAGQTGPLEGPWQAVLR